MLYRTIDFVLLACKRPRGSQGLAPGLSLSIILTLLSMIIDNERPGAINKQIIDNSECFGSKYVKIYPEITSQ
jgi:hypothetical protein